MARAAQQLKGTPSDSPALASHVEPTLGAETRQVLETSETPGVNKTPVGKWHMQGGKMSEKPVSPLWFL